MAELDTLKDVAEKDRKMIQEAAALLGPSTGAGFIKSLFQGHLRQELVYPYPVADAEEQARCEAMLAELDDYLQKEHPAIQIDRDQEIPRWVIDRLFRMGVLGMTVPKQYGGGGMTIGSYNRVLEHIGRRCGSTAVMVSAHQSIGCRAIILYGTEAQKTRWLPALATKSLSAFCLSEPNVGCDAGGQESHCEKTADGYILSGEKKWSTSGAIADLFTVMAKQKITDPKTGKPVEKVTALVCEPGMPGIDIFQKNRSKCGIRGTWQARIRFTDVHVPKENLLHEEGKGLNVALSCLDYGRCTLSAGMLGGAWTAFEQSTKWAQTRFQFQRPLAEFELVRAKIARMSALCHAMDAMLYLTCAMLDRHDKDIMLETAVCKVFCSEMGWRVVNDAMQIMGGEGYMTENEIERIFRDSRINLIVEGANEVMQSFIFAYGGKQVAEEMLGIRQGMTWDHHQSPTHNLARMVKGLKTAAPLGAEIYLGLRPAVPAWTGLHSSLQSAGERLCGLIREHAHQFKLASKHHAEAIITRQLVQARLADSAIWLHGWACVLSRLDRDAKAGINANLAAGDFFMAMAESEIRRCFAELLDNTDVTMNAAADAALARIAALPNSRFVIPESSPNAKGTGRKPGT